MRKRDAKSAYEEQTGLPLGSLAAPAPVIAEPGRVCLTCGATVELGKPYHRDGCAIALNTAAPTVAAATPAVTGAPAKDYRAQLVRTAKELGLPEEAIEDGDTVEHQAKEMVTNSARFYTMLAAAAVPAEEKLAEHIVSWEVIPDSSPLAGDAICVVRRDGFKGRRWAITKRGYVFSKNGEWEYEPQPSSREEEWLATVRWDSFNEAMAAALALRGEAGGGR